MPTAKWIKNAKLCLVLFCALVTTIAGCRAPSPDWNGAWKLDAPRSSYQGQFITIAISEDGEYRYSDGFVSTTFRCDGKYRPLEVVS